jgi:hypothetical protein
MVWSSAVPSFATKLRKRIIELLQSCAVCIIYLYLKGYICYNLLSRTSAVVLL